MKIAFGYGRGVVLYPKELTFEELAQMCSSTKKGTKFERYFIRGGEMELTEANKESEDPNQRSPHYHRNNKSLLRGEVLIIDGDASVENPKSAPPAKLIHEELIKLNIRHFIYTTHSHSPVKTRWRAIIPCVVDYKDVKKNSDSVKLTTNRICDRLAETTTLKRSGEQNTWSQPWYMPTRDDPEDGLFEYYEFFEGEEYKSINPETIPNYKVDEPISKQNLDYESVEDIYDDLLKGRHCYTSIRKITYMNIKDGQTKPATIANAKVLMQASPLKETDPGRWEGTYKQIEKLVEDAYNKLHEDKKLIDNTFLSDFDDDNVTIPEEILLPKNDMITELTLAIHKMWWTPNIMAARLAALATIAYLAGGKYRSSLGDRVNIQQVVIGPTGSGKDIIMKAPPAIIQIVWEDKMELRDKILAGIVEEIGSAEGVDLKIRSMGNKHDILVNVDEIGGLMRQAKKDMWKQKFFDLTLKMYTKSDGIMADRAVSRKLEKEHSAILYAPHMIISGATTPKLILSGMDSSFISYGNASRMMFFNCGPYAQENLRKCDELALSKTAVLNIKELFDQECIKKLHPLPEARIFSPKVVDMTECEEYCWRVAIEDKNKIGEFKDIWNRRVANAKKYAMIRAIFNDPINPKVTLDMIKNEMKFVGSSCEYSQRVFRNMIGENDIDIAKKSVISRLVKALEAGKTLVPQKVLNDTYCMRKMNPIQRKNILAELVDDGVVTKIEKTTVGGRGKKTIYYEFVESDEYVSIFGNEKLEQKQDD